MCSKVNRKCFYGVRETLGQEQLKNKQKNDQVWSHKGSIFWKNMTQFGQNSRPGESESDPYMFDYGNVS